MFLVLWEIEIIFTYTTNDSDDPSRLFLISWRQTICSFATRLFSWVLLLDLAVFASHCSVRPVD